MTANCFLRVKTPGRDMGKGATLTLNFTVQKLMHYVPQEDKRAKGHAHANGVKKPTTWGGKKQPNPEISTEISSRGPE